MRVGAVDIGSNAIRFLAVEFESAGRAVVLQEQRAPVRLGHDVFSTGSISNAASNAAVDALTGFRDLLRELRIDVFRAVATSAVRESANGIELVARIRAATGISVEAITGSEEARLVYLAVKRRVQLGRGKWLLVDLGGGSVEISLIDHERIRQTASYRMGSVRMLEAAGSSGSAPAAFRRQLDEFAKTLEASAAVHSPIAGFIATGGNIESLAELTGQERDETGVAHMPVGQLRAAIGRLAALSYDERVQQLGLHEDRADVILPAGMVYERIAARAGADVIIVPRVGVKDGILLDLIER